MIRRIVFPSVLLILLTISAAFAQTADCPTIVEQALTAVGDACADLERNQVCYGYNQVFAVDAENAVLPDFAAEGDVVDAARVTRISTTALDTAANQWGVAVLSLQATLPDTAPGQNVTFIIFGGVELQDEGGETPMQAFRFVSGLGTPQCAEVPRDGMLIQTPGVGTVSFTVNGVVLQVASTIYLTTSPDGHLEVTTVEGQAQVALGDAQRTVEAGFTVTIPEGEAPHDPQHTPYEALAALPLELLPNDQVSLPVEPDESTSEGDDEGGESPSTSGTAGIVDPVVGFVACSRNGVTVEAGQPFTLRLGWAELTLDALNAYALHTTQTAKYDGEVLPLTALTGPSAWQGQDEDGNDATGFAYNWFWYVPAALEGEHEALWEDSAGNSLTCIVTGE
jgi:hypothetical protein